MKYAKGYSQIEVLVSVLVLAIGFLGMAGLQTVSLQNAQKSVLRTQAAFLSYEILDRMRANPEQDYAVASDGFPNAVTNCATNACEVGQLKDFDLAQWKCALGDTNATCAGTQLDNSLYTQDNALPNGVGSIAYTASGEVTISIYWYEARDNSAPNPQTNINDYDRFILTTRI